MSTRVKCFGSFAVAPSGVTGTKSLSTSTGKCHVTAQTLGGAQNVLTFFISCLGFDLMPAVTSAVSLRKSNHVSQ